MKHLKHADVIAALAGTYSLVNNTVTAGGVIQPDREGWGPNPVGLLTYTRTGFMSANAAATVEEWRPQNLRFPPKATDSDADWNLIGRHTLAYAGPFSFNESVPVTKTHGKIIHGPLTVSNMPYMVGGTQARDYIVKEQDGVTYLYVTVTGTAANGLPLVSELVWSRIAKD